MFKKGDIILAATVLGLVIISYLYINFNKAGDGKIAVIKQEDKILKKIDLNRVNSPERVKIPGSYDEEILVEKGRIRFLEANCPDRVCVKTGWLSNKGDVAVCLPNRTIIKIEGEDKNNIDVIAY